MCSINVYICFMSVHVILKLMRLKVGSDPYLEIPSVTHVVYCVVSAYSVFVLVGVITLS